MWLQFSATYNIDTSWGCEPNINLISTGNAPPFDFKSYEQIETGFCPLGLPDGAIAYAHALNEVSPTWMAYNLFWVHIP